MKMPVPVFQIAHDRLDRTHGEQPLQHAGHATSLGREMTADRLTDRRQEIPSAPKASDQEPLSALKRCVAYKRAHGATNAGGIHHACLYRGSLIIDRQ
jgi:hypothetical protein